MCFSNLALPWCRQQAPGGKRLRAQLQPPGLGLPLLWPQRCHPLEGQGAGLAGERALRGLLTLRVLHKAPEDRGSCVDTETGTGVSQLWHLAPPWQPLLLPPKPDRGPWSLFTGCSRLFLFLMEHFSWDVTSQARKVSPGHGARREVDERPCGCGQGCVAGLPLWCPSARALWPLSPCLHPSLQAACAAGILPEGTSTGDKGSQHQCSRATVQGHNSAVSRVPTWFVTLRRQLGACRPILPAHKAFPLPVPQFPCLPRFPQHHQGTRAVPAAPGPAEPPRPLPAAAPGAGSQRCLLSLH